MFPLQVLSPFLGRVQVVPEVSILIQPATLPKAEPAPMNPFFAVLLLDVALELGVVV